MWLSTSASTELGAGVLRTTMSVSVFDVEATSTGDSTIVVLVNDVGVFLEVDVFWRTVLWGAVMATLEVDWSTTSLTVSSSGTANVSAVLINQSINRSLSVTLLFLWVSAELFCFELSEALTRGQDYIGADLPSPFLASYVLDDLGAASSSLGQAICRLVEQCWTTLQWRHCHSMDLWL